MAVVMVSMQKPKAGKDEARDIPIANRLARRAFTGRYLSH